MAVAREVPHLHKESLDLFEVAFIERMIEALNGQNGVEHVDPGLMGDLQSLLDRSDRLIPVIRHRVMEHRLGGLQGDQPCGRAPACFGRLVHLFDQVSALGEFPHPEKVEGAVCIDSQCGICL